MLNQSEVYEAWGRRLSKTCIVKRDDTPESEWVAKGRYCIAAFDDDGRLDVWLCNALNLRQPLSPARLNALMARFPKKAAQQGGDWRVLDGEAWSKSFTPAEVAEVARFLGLRRKGKPPARPFRKAADGPAVQP